jgi:hypothetical protein
MLAPIFKHVIRKPEDLTYPHKHHPTAGMLMSRRILDAEKDAKIHMLAWRFNNKRSQWEAVCEREDVIFYATPTDADIEFRKGRNYE